MMTLEQVERLEACLDTMARQFRYALKWTETQRAKEGLTTTPDSAVEWPVNMSCAPVQCWAETLEESMQLLALARAVLDAPERAIEARRVTYGHGDFGTDLVVLIEGGYANPCPDESLVGQRVRILAAKGEG